MDFTRLVTRLVVVLLVASISATAQPLTIHHVVGTGASLEFTLPQIKTDPGEEVSTMIVSTTLRLRASETSVLTLSLPYLRHSYHYNYRTPFINITADGRNDGLMNLGLGIVTRTGENTLWEILTTIPLVSKENAGLGFAGVMSDFDRFESYLHKVLSIGGYGNLMTADRSTFIGRFRMGPTIWMPVGDQGDETEASLDAGLGAGVRFGRIEVGAFLTSRTILTEEKLFGDKTIIHTSFSAQVALTRFLIQAYYRIPHNDAFQQSLNGTMGIVGVFTW